MPITKLLCKAHIYIYVYIYIYIYQSTFENDSCRWLLGDHRCIHILHLYNVSRRFKNTPTHWVKTCRTPPFLQSFLSCFLHFFFSYFLPNLLTPGGGENLPPLHFLELWRPRKLPFSMSMFASIFDDMRVTFWQPKAPKVDPKQAKMDSRIDPQIKQKLTWGISTKSWTYKNARCTNFKNHAPVWASCPFTQIS